MRNEIIIKTVTYDICRKCVVAASQGLDKLCDHCTMPQLHNVDYLDGYLGDKDRHNNGLPKRLDETIEHG